MEVNFVDVGLGSCQVIHLGNRRAIVIDCGVRKDYIALHFLKKLGINRIERLITSHSDNDHTGGAISILDDFQDQIDEIHVVQDHKWLRTKYWQRIEYFVEQGVLQRGQVRRLEIEERPKLLWSNSSGSTLRLFSPDFIENQQAQQRESANSTSSVIVLDHLGHRVVFAADSEIPQWREIFARRGNETLSTDVLAVPHHGGLIEASASDLQWLYDQAISASFAILSVGTRRNPRHPREDVVARLIASRSTVLCTELTNKCHSSPEDLHPGVLRPLSPFGLSADNAVRRKSHCVGCAGTVVATIDSDSCQITRLREHQAAVDALAATTKGHPLCR